MSDKKFTSLKDFYPYYLAEHSNPVCRLLHFIGTSIALIILVMVVLGATPILLLVGVVQGYFWAWVGHFVFEKNKPATFEYPFYSFVSDWLMYRDMWVGRIDWDLKSK